MSKATVKTLDDGFKITIVECACGGQLTITSKDCTFLSCSCGRQHMNIAYFHRDETGMLCYNDDDDNVKQ